MDDNGIILFTHVLRTGGGTIKKLFRRNYPIRKFKYNAIYGIYTLCGEKLNRRRNWKFVDGFFPYGFHKKIKKITDGKDIKYITFVRTPYQRWKSFFYYYYYMLCPNDKSRWFYHIWKFCAGEDFLKFLEYCLEHQIQYNTMTLQFSGGERRKNIVYQNPNLNVEIDLKGIVNENDYLNSTHSYVGSKRKKKYEHSDMIHFLEKAKYNVKNNYHFVGVMEYFKKDINKMINILDLNRYSISKINRGKYPQIYPWQNNRKAKILLNELNKYDKRLYQYILEERRR